MALKVKRQFPYTERAFNGRIALDDKFDAADKKRREAHEQMTQVAEASLAHAARKLLAAARLFSTFNPSVSDLISELNAFGKDKNVTALGEAARSFHSLNPINQLSPGSPEHSLVYACHLIGDACLYLADNAPEPAYRATVSCRFALRFVGE